MIQGETSLRKVSCEKLIVQKPDASWGQAKVQHCFLPVDPEIVNVMSPEGFCLSALTFTCHMFIGVMLKQQRTIENIDKKLDKLMQNDGTSRDNCAKNLS